MLISKKTGELTVLIFKDNHSSRTFRVPLTWISRFGFLLLLGALMLATTSFFALKFFRDTKVSDTGRVMELEKQLAEYEKQYEEVAEAPTFSPLSNAKIQTDSSTPAEGYPPFRALPDTYRLANADSPSSVALKNIEINIEDKKVGLKFWIQNTRRSGGLQQGRIIILARGPDALRVYPKGALNPAGSASLIEPERGEYFSINKFRETIASFDVPSGVKSDALSEFEIFILGKSNEILVTRRVLFSMTPMPKEPLEATPVENAPAPRARPKPVAAPPVETPQQQTPPQSQVPQSQLQAPPATSTPSAPAAPGTEGTPAQETPQ